MKSILALAIILSINVFLFLGNYAIYDITGNNTLINYNDDLIGKFNVGNTTNPMLNEDVTSKIPSGQGSISPETGNLFTDTWATLTSWFTQTTGLNYLYGIVNAVPLFLKRFLNPVLAYAIGFFWHALTIYIIINVLRGGD